MPGMQTDFMPLQENAQMISGEFQHRCDCNDSIIQDSATVASQQRCNSRDSRGLQVCKQGLLISADHRLPSCNAKSHSYGQMRHDQACFHLGTVHHDICLSDALAIICKALVAKALHGISMTDCQQQPRQNRIAGASARCIARAQTARSMLIS